MTDSVYWLRAVGAASPGFDVRPARRRATLQILPNSPPPLGSTSPTTERSPLFSSHPHATASDADLDASTGQQRTAHLRRLAREKGRTKSLSGGVYVGRTSFDGEREREQHIAVHGLGLPFDVRTAGEGDVFADGAGLAGEAREVRQGGKKKGAGWRKLKARFAETFGAGAGDGRRRATGETP